MIVKEFDFYPFELTDVWGMEELNIIYVVFKVSIQLKQWTTFGFFGILRDIFEVNWDEIKLVEVSKDGNSIYLIFAVENTRLITKRSSNYLLYPSIENSNVEYVPIH